MNEGFLPFLPSPWNGFASAALIVFTVYTCAFYTGWSFGRLRLSKHMHEQLRAMAQHFARELEWQHRDTSVHSTTINVNKTVIDACRALDLAAFGRELRSQFDMDSELAPPDDVLLPTMHMIRAGHHKFNQGEQEWSKAWLAKNGFAQGDDERGWGGSIDPLNGGGKDPTIN